MKLYGSLNNRLEENRINVEEIRAGQGVTKYSYTDRTPYIITKVINQNNFYIREMRAERTDSNGMSEMQEYNYFDDLTKPEEEIIIKKGAFYRVRRYSKESLLNKAEQLKASFKSNGKEKAYKYLLCMAPLTDKQREKIEQGKEVKHYDKINISVGVMEKYFDYSF